MFLHWLRGEFILVDYHFWLLRLNFHLVLSSPLPLDLLERKITHFFPRHRYAYHYPVITSEIPSHTDMRCACVVLIFICLRFLQAVTRQIMNLG